MTSTSGNDYIGAAGPDGFQVWRPTPYPLSAVQSQSNPSQGVQQPGSGGSGGSGGGGGTQPATAQALFFTATCQASDAIGSFVRADAGANAVTAVTCYQPYPAIGAIISKSSATACVVQTYGINAAFSGLTANSRYFVGPQGQPILATALPANAPYVQPIGFAVQAQQLFIQPSGILYRRDVSGAGQGDGPGAGDTVAAYMGALLHGAAPPDNSIGNIDDFYLQTGTSPVLWGPKDLQSGWPSQGVSLVGPAGQAGNRIFWGDGPPDDSLGQQPGDAYISRTTGLLYEAA